VPAVLRAGLWGLLLGEEGRAVRTGRPMKRAAWGGWAALLIEVGKLLTGRKL